MERTLDAALSGIRPLEHQTFQRGADAWIVVHRDRTGCDGYDLWLPRADLQEIWRLWVDVGRAQPVGLRAWDWSRTEAGIPWYGVDMDDKTLPMEMGLDSALSTTKGCYRGQEIVARITHRGHLDRRLGGLLVESSKPPIKGAEVRSQGSKIGEVTSATESPRLGKPLALAVLRTAFLEPGTSVEVECAAGFRPGTVVALPLPGR